MEDGEDEHSLDTMPGNNSSTGSDRDGMSSSSSQETPLLSDFQVFYRVLLSLEYFTYNHFLFSSLLGT